MGSGKKKSTNQSPQFVGTEGRPPTTNQPTNNFKVDSNRWMPPEPPNQRMLRDGS